MPTTGDLLARRYRRLLLCYPRDYRQVRGEEIVTTLLDTAPPGRTWPTLREAANLIRHGLRARLGRPASRTIVAFAALTAVICGLFTAALASRIAWETARPLPKPAEAAEVFTSILPDHELGEITPARALFVAFSHPVTWENVDILIGDGGEYQQGTVEAVVNGSIDPQPTLAMARQRLRETGWQVYDPLQDTTVSARRGDTILELNIHPHTGVNGTYSAIFSLRRVTPPAVYPAAVFAGMLGAAAAWLLFGWASRRTETHHPARTAVTACYAITMFMWWLPAFLSVPHMLSHHLSEPHPQWHPLWEWLGQPAAALLFLVGCGSTLLSLALAALPKRDPDLLSTVAAG